MRNTKVKNIYKSKKIGTKLKDFRLKHGLSQTQVAELLGISSTTAGAWEREGRIQYGKDALLDKLCKEYELPQISTPNVKEDGCFFNLNLWFNSFNKNRE